MVQNLFNNRRNKEDQAAELPNYTEHVPVEQPIEVVKMVAAGFAAPLNNNNADVDIAEGEQSCQIFVPKRSHPSKYQHLNTSQNFKEDIDERTNLMRF